MTKTFEILPGDSIVFVPTIELFFAIPPAKWFLSKFVFSEPWESPCSFLTGKTLGKGSKEEMVLLGESLGLEPKVIEGSLGFFRKDPSGKFLLGTKDEK